MWLDLHRGKNKLIINFASVTQVQFFEPLPNNRNAKGDRLHLETFGTMPHYVHIVLCYRSSVTMVIC